MVPFRYLPSFAWHNTWRSSSYWRTPVSILTPVEWRMEKVRVSKLMAAQGLCSRREADTYIERGWVFVDGERITELGTKILPSQRITLARAAASEQTARVTILINKPIGYVSGQPEPGYKPAVSLVVPDTHWADDSAPQRFERAHLSGLAPAGRLDIDSTGLLVLTQDGRIARQLVGQDRSSRGSPVGCDQARGGRGNRCPRRRHYGASVAPAAAGAPAAGCRGARLHG